MSACLAPNPLNKHGFAHAQLESCLWLIAGMASKNKQKISTITDRIHTSVFSILNETIGQPSPSTLRASTSRSPGSGVVEGSASGALSSVCEGIYIVAFNLPIF